LCEETHNLYTKAKDSLVEACGGADRLPTELMSIRPNFIEQLKERLDLELSDQEREENPPSTESVRLSWIDR
jgi:hypothetical protein